MLNHPSPTIEEVLESNAKKFSGDEQYNDKIQTVIELLETQLIFVLVEVVIDTAAAVDVTGTYGYAKSNAVVLIMQVLAENYHAVVGVLIDVETEEHLWEQSYEREVKDIFAIQSGVAKQIASALETELSAEEIARIEKDPTGNLDA